MISRQQGMEMDVDQGTTGSGMVEILGKLTKKNNKDDQLDQKFFQEDSDNKKNQQKSLKEQ